jgi:hypothetical protein
MFGKTRAMFGFGYFSFVNLLLWIIKNKSIKVGSRILVSRAWMGQSTWKDWVFATQLFVMPRVAGY